MTFKGQRQCTFFSSNTLNTFDHTIVAALSNTFALKYSLKIGPMWCNESNIKY